MKKLFLIFALCLSAAAQISTTGGISTPFPNSGAVQYGTAKKQVSSGATVIVPATTSDVTDQSYIVSNVVGSGGATALLAVSGQASCTMDGTNSSAINYYVVNSTTNSGECHAQSSPPSSGVWVIGFVNSPSTTLGQTSLVSIVGFFYSAGGGSVGPGTGGFLSEWTGSGSSTALGNSPLDDNGAFQITSTKGFFINLSNPGVPLYTGLVLNSSSCGSATSFYTSPGCFTSEMSHTKEVPGFGTGGYFQGVAGTNSTSPSLISGTWSEATASGDSALTQAAGAIGVSSAVSASLTNSAGVLGLVTSNSSVALSNQILAGVEANVKITGSTQPLAASFYAQSPTLTGAVTNFYGFYMEPQNTGGANNPNPHGFYQAGTEPNTFNGLVNGIAGFQYNGTAPSGHCLLGNGTAYIDSSLCGGSFSALASGTNNNALVMGSGGTFDYSGGLIDANQLLKSSLPSLAIGYLQWTGSAWAFGTPAGSGTVTSASQTVNGSSSSGIFTITGSPITSTGTFNIATAGTSGGLPYFSSSSVISSSGALTGVIRGGSPPTASELSQDVTTSGSNAATVVGLKANLLPSLTTGYLQWTGSAWAFGTPSGSGTVTTASCGNLSPLFTCTVGTPTSTPAFAFSIDNAAQNSVFAGPASGGSGAPTFQTAPTISAANMTSFPTLNQNTTGNAATATNISTNGSANQVWAMNSGASAQGWQTFVALPSGTLGNPLVNSSGSTTYATTPAVVYGDQLTGSHANDWCDKVRTFISNLPSGSSGTLDMSGLSGAQSCAVWPFIDIAGTGYSPTKTGKIIIGSSLTLTAAAPFPGMVPGGWTIVAPSPQSGSSTVGAYSVYSGPGTYTTGTATDTVSTGGSSSTYTKTVTLSTSPGSSVIPGEQYLACGGNTATAAYSGSACGSTFASSPWSGTITAVSGTTLTVVTNSSVAANSSAYDFVVFPASGMGDGSGISGNSQNLNVEVSGLRIDSNGVAGYVPYYNKNCANHCKFHNNTLDGTEVGALSDGPATQQSAFYDNFIIGQSGHCTVNSYAMIIRASTAPPQPFRDNWLVMTQCGLNGVNTALAIDAPVKWEAGKVFTNASSVISGSSAILVGGAPICPVACVSAPQPTTGADIENVNFASYANYGLNWGTNLSPNSYIVKEIRSSAGGSEVTDIFNDQNTGCVPSENILASYVVNSSQQISQSSSSASTCQTQIGVAINRQTGTTYTYSSSADLGVQTQFANASAIAVTLPAASSMATGWFNESCDMGTGTATITSTSTLNINTGTAVTTGTSQTLSTGQCIKWTTNNTSYVGVLEAASGLGDPGGNGVVYRSALNTTADANVHNIAAPFQCADTSSSATTYTCTVSPNVTPATGDIYIFTGINQNNSGPATLNINGHGAVSIKKWQGTNLAANDLLAGSAVALTFDGTNMELATVGNPPNGTPVSDIDVTGQSANISATTILTPSANGFYRAVCYVVLTTAATSSSTLPDCNIVYTDADTSVAGPQVLTASKTANTVGTIGTIASGPGVGNPFGFYAQGGQAIKYSTSGYASSGATAMQYSVHLRLEGPF